MSPAPEQTEMTTAGSGLVRTAGSLIGFGLSASNWDEGIRIATMLAGSALVPKAYQGKPEDVVVAMQYGAEIGLPPMAALQSVAVINGKPGVYGDGFLAVIQSSPHYVKHVEYYVTGAGEIVKSLRKADLEDDDTRSVSKFWRKGVEEPFEAEFSIGDAKRAHLWTKDGPWKEYPQRQLRWRSREFAARDGFADKLRGVRMFESLRDDPEPIVESHTVPFPVRRSEKPAEDAPATTETPEPQPAAQTTEPARPKAERTSKPAKPAKPSARPPASEAPPANETTEALAITDTAYVTPIGVEPFYEVRARVEKKGQAPIAYVFLTRDKALYELAESAEGSGQLMTIAWHRGRRPDDTECKILDAISAS